MPMKEFLGHFVVAGFSAARFTFCIARDVRSALRGHQ